MEVMRVNRNARGQITQSEFHEENSPDRRRSTSKDIRHGSRGRSQDQNVDDLEAEFESDEDKLIASLKRKREDKSKFVGQVRERQQKLIDINDKIRKYDLNVVKDEEIDNLKY